MPTDWTRYYNACAKGERLDICEELDFYLYEMATIGLAQEKIKGKKFLVGVDSDPQRIGNQYFKFYDSLSQEKAEHVARISFNTPEYVYHKGYPKAFKLNKKEKKALIKFLNAKSTALGFKDFTNWQRAIILYNQEAINVNFDWSIFNKEYISKHKAKIQNSKLKGALPIDLEMPDYSLLPEP